MTPELLLHLRVSILKQVEAASSRGLTVSAILIGVKSTGVKASDSDADKELQYLIDKGLLRKEKPHLNPEIWRACITADGRDFLAQEGY